MQARLIGRTEGFAGTEYAGRSIDEIIVGIARISSSRETNELFSEPEKLLRYLLLNSHFSPFEMANLTFEVKTSRAIGRELIRHKSLGIQEISGRYVATAGFEDIEFRLQAKNNRQSSTDKVGKVIYEEETLGDEGPFQFEYCANDATELNMTMGDAACNLSNIYETYKLLLEQGVARETARMILPETAQTTLIFNGTVRSWITLLNVRLHETAQKECRLVAESIRDTFIKECPIIANSLFNFQDAYTIHVLDQLVLEKWGCLDMVRANGLKKLKGGPPV